jgi:hypothetical protein
MLHSGILEQPGRIGLKTSLGEFSRISDVVRIGMLIYMIRPTLRRARVEDVDQNANLMP